MKDDEKKALVKSLSVSIHDLIPGAEKTADISELEKPLKAKKPEEDAKNNGGE